MNHLPECAAPQDFWRTCICENLRACEQRVTEQWESLRGWGESYAYKTGSDRGFDAGYVAALDAAEAAVADVGIDFPFDIRDVPAYGKKVLAAISALREEK